MSGRMLESIKSALNRMRPGHQPHSPKPQPKSPRDTFAAHAKARAPYDPHKPHRAGAQTRRHAGGAQGAGGAVASPRAAAGREVTQASAPVDTLVTPEKLAASRVMLDAMQVDAFIGQMVACASCPTAVAQDPVLQQVQAIAMQEYTNPAWVASWATPLLHAAARDMCGEFSGKALQALAAFARTEAGAVLFALVPLLRVQLKYGEPLGHARTNTLCDDDKQALLACLKSIDPKICEALNRLPAEVMDLSWTRPFTPDVIQDIAAFVRRAEGRAFVDYTRRGCWLGIPHALVVQRDAWVAGVQSDMVSILQQEGVPVPPPYDAMPMYVQSHVTIEELPTT